MRFNQNIWFGSQDTTHLQTAWEQASTEEFTFGLGSVPAKYPGYGIQQMFLRWLQCAHGTERTHDCKLSATGSYGYLKQ